MPSELAGGTVGACLVPMIHTTVNQSERQESQHSE